MKFGELKPDDWAELAPYLDTCLLPVTGLNGDESPPEAADKAARAGAWLQPLETAFRGRTVTMPAYHYADGADDRECERLARYCERLKSAGFRYLIVVTGESGWKTRALPAADLIVGPGAPEEEPDDEALRRAVADLWRRNRE